MSDFGSRIRNRRTELRLSMRELAKRSDLSVGFICDLEHGRRSVSIDNAAKIAASLGVSVASLTGDKVVPESLRSLADAARSIARLLEWDIDMIADFHAYAHRFGGQPGSNVYKFALCDALNLRGMTLEQLRNGGQQA